MLKKIRFRYQILMVCLLTSILSFIAVMEMLTMQHKQMTELYYKDTVELLEAESDKLSIKIKQVRLHHSIPHGGKLGFCLAARGRNGG